MTKSSVALMLNWRSSGQKSLVNRVQLALCTTFLFSFFLLIILVQIPSTILEDREKSKKQSYLAKNKSRTFCDLVHRFHRITAKRRATLPWKGWPNKQYCQQNNKLTGSFDGQVEIMMAWESGQPGSTCAVHQFSILFFSAHYTCRNWK